MPIWTSPLFSDIRNALEDNVVFSSWKGRSYFRSYAIPAQPRTPPQRATRDTFRQIVRRFQGFIGGVTANKKKWDDLATPYQMSGFNLFTRYGQGSNIAASPPAAGATAITYSTNIPLTNAALYRLTGATITLIQPLTLASGTINLTALPAGTHSFFIGHRFVVGETPAQSNLVTMWRDDPVAGVAVPATITVP